MRKIYNIFKLMIGILSLAAKTLALVGALLGVLEITWYDFLCSTLLVVPVSVFVILGLLEDKKAIRDISSERASKGL